MRHPGSFACTSPDNTSAGGYVRRRRLIPIWLAALFFGSAVTDAANAQAIISALGESNVRDAAGGALDATVAGLCGKGPGSTGVEGLVHRGQGWEWPPKDPVLYRLYEVLVVYGWSYKAIIQEKFGDGIMSAINFRTSVERKVDPAGDRVVITMDGKFLPYMPANEW
ncbi:Cyanate hydratase [Cryptotrichosporon argae]